MKDCWWCWGVKGWQLPLKLELRGVPKPLLLDSIVIFVEWRWFLNLDLVLT